jgi:hypothetical protein
MDTIKFEDIIGSVFTIPIRTEIDNKKKLVLTIIVTNVNSSPYANYHYRVLNSLNTPIYYSDILAGAIKAYNDYIV